MALTADAVAQLVAGEMRRMTDVRVLEHVRALLIEPAMTHLDWDYGPLGQQYPCWILLRPYSDGMSIFYSDHGFGPRCPWGLAWTSGSMGQDSGWFPRFWDAYFDSYFATELPIWRVTKDVGAQAKFFSEEMDWDAAWHEVKRLHETQPDAPYYHAHHSIPYENGT